MTPSDRLRRVVRSELFKLRTTSAWWQFSGAMVLTTLVLAIVGGVNARTALKPFAEYVQIRTHGRFHGATVPPEFLSRLRGDWVSGHSAVTQAVTLYSANQLIGLLLVCLLGIVLVTTEFAQRTATSTFLITPRRGTVVAGKLITAVMLAVVAWFVTTLISLTSGVLFLHGAGHGTQLGYWGVDRSVLLNLVAYILWAIFGIGFGALIRNQLVATVSATILYLVGAGAAGALFDLLNSYVLSATWVLGLQVIAPAVASQVMISPTSLFTGSPPQWVGAAVLIAYSALFIGLGLRRLRRSDIG
ncbi:MAG: hypothetical protein JWR52_519 [Marmoricola sp.]|nr:hypothetical protein [Marmoricola sp.]